MKKLVARIFKRPSNETAFAVCALVASSTGAIG